MATQCEYVGWEELTFGSYLRVHPGGEVTTLVGTPGMGPVSVRPAVGYPGQPEVPAGGLWVPVQQELAPQQSTAPQAGTGQQTTKSEEVG